MPDDEEPIGARIRRHRRARGLSLDQAAGLAGISKPYLSRLERGERSVDSRSLLIRVATALDVAVTDLTGQPYTPRDRDHAQVHRSVNHLRLALLDPSGAPAVSLEHTLAEVQQLHVHLRDGDLVAQARWVPRLLRTALQHATHHPSAGAHHAVLVSAHAAVFLLRGLGELDLAWIASQRMRDAAEALDDPACTAWAAFSQAHTLIPVGAMDRALDVATTAGEASTGAHAADLAGRGSCLLVGAFAAACTSDIDGARARLHEARDLATRIGPNMVSDHTCFAPWNVTMYHTAVEVEAGNASTALTVAEPLLRSPAPNAERMSYLWIDVGRAFAQLDRHRDAIAAIRAAELLNPLRVRLSPVVRNSVRDLLTASSRRASGAQLRGLAERCGVLTNAV